MSAMLPEAEANSAGTLLPAVFAGYTTWGLLENEPLPPYWILNLIQPQPAGFKLLDFKGRPPPRSAEPRVHHRERGGNTGFIRATPLFEDPQSAASRSIAHPGQYT
jgi:hypothetical protein